MSSTRLILATVSAAALSIVGCERSANNTTPTKKPAPTTTTPDTTQRTPPSTVRPDPTKAPDNTAQNRPDRDPASVTPEDQSNANTDVELTAAIRRAIMRDEALSTNAKNVKIIADKAGTVTLRGVVESQAERDAVEAKAKATAGVKQVNNMLDIKAP